jgi:sugar lactone lactonase YvrE
MAEYCVVRPIPTRRPIGAREVATLVVLAAATVGFACSPPQRSSAAKVADVADGVSAGVSTSELRFVRTILGFEDPESVRYDPDGDVFFVSNMAGYGSVRDGNGFISVVSAANPDSSAILAQGGRGGVTLNSPKGIALHGDTLWVADIDALRAFDRHSGAPLATVDFRPEHAVLLNDVAVGPDGTIRVTDTGILMNEPGIIHTGPDRIFSVGADREITVVDSGPQLRQPNGITWDAAGRRWIVVSFDPYDGEVAALGERGRRQLLHRALGKLDGVEALADGALLFSSWADSSVHLLAGGRDRQLVRNVPEPADFGIDVKRNRIAIPLSTLGRVELWTLPASHASTRGATVSLRNNQ